MRNLSVTATSANRALGWCVLLCGCLVLPGIAAGQCSYSWSEDFGARGVGGSVNQWEVSASCIFDDGGGPALYIGGRFYSVEGTLCKCLARWDGVGWTCVGGGITGPFPESVAVMTVFDDGTGPALIVGGKFSHAGGVPAENIARWNGREWSPLGAGIAGSVRSLEVFDDGGGKGLFVGGGFSKAGPLAVSNLARWDGKEWTDVGGGTNGFVFALKGRQSSAGNALYVGGAFTLAGGVTANSIACWDGEAWTPLGAGMSYSFAPIVGAIEFFDSGQGPELYAGGRFTGAGGIAVNHIARWNGQNWSPVGSGIQQNPGLVVSVSCLRVFDSGRGASLYVGGAFSGAGGVQSPALVRWDGQQWHSVDGGMGGNGKSFPHAVATLTTCSLPRGPVLFAGGDFGVAGEEVTRGVALWDGVSWSTLGSGHGMNGTVYALKVLPGPAGATLYAGGYFTSAGGAAAYSIARWGREGWEALGEGMGGAVYALESFDDGSGEAIYAGGSFTTIGPSGTQNIARWSGETWTALGAGIPYIPGTGGWVNALAVHDDGTGPSLYAGGYFEKAGGSYTENIARWDGATWWPVGNGIAGEVFGMCPWTVNGETVLVVCGEFTSPGNRIAQWDGTSWKALGAGLSAAANTCLAFDDGTGMQLYVGGKFSKAGGVPAYSVARWDGKQWGAVGAGPGWEVLTLAACDVAGVQRLCAGDKTYFESGARVMVWNGSTWSPLAPGFRRLEPGWNGGEVHAIASFDDGAGSQLFVGGWFSAVEGVAVEGIARGHCAPICVGDIDGDGKTCQSDLGALLATYGLCEGDPGYNPAANLSQSQPAGCPVGKQGIDQSDLGLLLADFGCGGCP